MTLELFCCSGGMAEGFRRAGVSFDLAFDFDADACASYEANLGRAPIRMDVHHLLAMTRKGWRPASTVDLLVADPPCTPWSRAGKRLGIEDERDMLEETTELIGLLRPQAYLIGNVPGLDDSNSRGVIQRVIGGLARHGYCVADYTSLDAADYGVPQHRVRPFWYGHLAGPCIRWPLPTHGEPNQQALPGLHLEPWVTCRDALQHLLPDELGRPVELRLKAIGSTKHGRSWDDHPTSRAEAPAQTIRADGGRPGRRESVLLADPRHPSARPCEPAPTVGAKDRCQSTVLEWPWDRPATTIHEDPRLAPPGHHGPSFRLPPESRGTRKKRPPSTKGHQWERRADPDAPSPTVLTDTARVKSNSPRLAWPWDQPSPTIMGGTADGKLCAPGKGSLFSGPRAANAIVLSERAAAILQGFPGGWRFCGRTKKSRWAQIGMAMPPALAEAVARSVIEQLRAQGIA